MPSIPDLMRITRPTGDDLLPVFDVFNGDTRKLTLNDLKTWVGDTPDNTGWAAYFHTGAPQVFTANVKQTLDNNAGTKIETQLPLDVEHLYDAGLITGRNGDSIGLGVELIFTPSDGTASNMYMAVDIGGDVGEIYPEDFAIFRGSGVAHKISYVILAYTLDTWQANGGAVKVEVDGPGTVTGVRYVIHRLHKAR